MTMAENPKLDLEPESLFTSCEDCGLGEMKDNHKISISETANGFQFPRQKSDSFVVDLESFSHGVVDKDVTANSRIILQRSLSRKGTPRGAEKPVSASSAFDRDTLVATSSPRASSLVGSAMLEKPMMVTLGATDRATYPQVHHQITITPTNIGATTAESKSGLKRCGSRRAPPSWVLDPRRILLLFATLSSVGTILLIFFTLSMGKLNADDDALNW